MAIEFYSNKTDKRDSRKPFYTSTANKRPSGLATIAYIWANIGDTFFTDEIADVVIDSKQGMRHRSNCSNYAKMMELHGLIYRVGKEHQSTHLGKKALVYGRVEDPAYLSPELQWLAKSADSIEQLYSMLGWLDND